MRASGFAVYALDLPAVLTVAQLMGADLDFMMELLPAIEPLFVRAWQSGDEEEA